ncbi:dihydrolipoamide acetyltransferase family protein [Aminivibrio sp.]|uniref:dihydrolipoamide acetyltransferase family protein n=2 Tax=Aminivibrio sp. TaxID=1872489 RepID=UPI00345E73EF
MATPVTMPKLGLTMNSGTISRWNRQEGEPVGKGELLMTVATDKLTFEVESPAEGTVLKIVVSEGRDVPVGEILAYIGQPGDSIESVAVDGADPRTKEIMQDPEDRRPAVSTEKISVPSGLRATPLARKTARESGIDISQVPGSGPGGRIVRKDVDAFVVSPSRGKTKASPTAEKMAADLGVDITGLETQGRVMKADVATAASQAKPFPGAEDVRIPLTRMRKIIAERMSLSRATIPSVTFNMEADFTALMEFREKIKAEGAKKGVKISYNHILMKICASAVKEVPLANASFDGDAIVLHGNVNMGIAVSVDGGLLVPNVKAVQAKTLLEVALETEHLVEQARSGKLGLEDMQGGTFTLTNLGMFGMHSFSPIVNPPEACILGVNAIVEKPAVVNGSVVIRPMSVLSLVADHRILDGAEAARFLARIREMVENPWLLLL